MILPSFASVLFSPLGASDNQAAYQRVLDVARRCDAKVTLFGVVPEPSRFRRLLHMSGIEMQVHEAEIAQMAETITELHHLDAGDDVSIGVAAEVGVARRSVAIIEQVLAHGHDLVVVTTDEDDADGATIRRLLQWCPCPVWVIRPTPQSTPRVLAAVNPDPDEEELNRSILELAVAMCDTADGELHIVHAWELYGETTMRESAFIHMPADAVDDLVEQERQTRHDALEHLLESTLGGRYSLFVHLIKGDPTAAIPALVIDREIDLLVMGTVARAGLSGLIVGNTADKVLDEVNSSVIAIKPPGFVSPITTSHARHK